MTEYRLDEAGARILKEVVKVVRQMIQNKHPVFYDPGPASSSEVYIALPPAAGIPALDELTDGDPGEGDLPGSATCDIYQIIDGELIQIEAVDKTVYNLSTTRIPQQWISVKKDKFGSWIADLSTSNEAVGSGSVGTFDCYGANEIFGVNINEIGESDTPTFVLSVTGNAFGYCITKTRVSECTVGTV